MLGQCDYVASNFRFGSTGYCKSGKGGYSCSKEDFLVEGSEARILVGSFKRSILSQFTDSKSNNSILIRGKYVIRWAYLVSSSVLDL